MKSLTFYGGNCLVSSPFSMLKPKAGLAFSCKYYSTSNSFSESNDLPLPIFTFNNLNNPNCIKSHRKLLKDKGGITYHGYNLRYFSTSNKILIRDIRKTPLDNENKSSLIILKPNYITGLVMQSQHLEYLLLKVKLIKLVELLLWFFL